MTGLPEEFRKKMERLLGDEFKSFLESYDNERIHGLRLNRLKVEKEEAERLLKEFQLRPVPWTEDGYYYDKAVRPGKHPYHSAGLYYIQEPSAMAVVTLLNPMPGEKILDLCAAPGGKTSHIASRLQGKGFLLSNEIHPARARILSQNVERMGIGNAVVSNEDSGRLARIFPEFFDRIAVDAPCSGEGMFRKEEEAREQWSPENVISCGARQDEILHNASVMLKKGGFIVYSTCTFSPEEDEQSVERFLRSHPDFEIFSCKELLKAHGYNGLSRGRQEWGTDGRKELEETYRIFPHHSQGEGHFIAVLRKRPEERGESSLLPEKKKKAEKEPEYVKDKKMTRDIEAFLADICPGAENLRGRREWILFGEQLYLVPEEMKDMKGLRIVRPGLHVASLKKNRLEPAHGLAMYLKKQEAARSREVNEEEAIRFLKGETLQGGEEKGWTLICLKGYPLGWAKEAGGILKNHYPKGLRYLG